MDTPTSNNTVEIIPSETRACAAAVTDYWQAWGDKPCETVAYQYLPAMGPALTVAQLQGAHQLRRSVTGKVTAQYMYQLVYRALPQTTTDRLAMDALLNAAADYAEAVQLHIGPGRVVTRHAAQGLPVPIGRTETGAEDWGITMVVEYTYNSK